MGRLAKDHFYKTGDVVPSTGIYSVFHSEHRLPHEVILIGGDVFPRCSKCPVGVTFALVREARAGFEHHPVRVYELPDMEDEENQTNLRKTQAE
jgi:hypothetical protein